MSTDLITTAQINFVITLATDKSVAITGAPDSEHLLHLIARAVNPAAISATTLRLSKREGSILINRLKGLPSNPDPSVPEAVAKSVKSGINRYEGTCTGCGNVVAANEGFYYLLPTGKYANHHKVDQCPAAAPQAPTVEVGEGFYSTDGEYFQVYRTRNGHLATHILSPSGSWVYRTGGLSLLRRATDLTTVDEKTIVNTVCLRKYGALPGTAELAEIAAKYGAQRGVCIFCARDLTDERSNPALGGVGYGPICAQRYELPWGEVALVK